MRHVEWTEGRGGLGSKGERERRQGGKNGVGKTLTFFPPVTLLAGLSSSACACGCVEGGGRVGKVGL